MELSAIFHDMSKRYCFALKKGEIAIRIKTKKNDVSKVIIHTKDKYLDIHGIETEQEFLMQKVASDTINDYYEIALTIDVICLRYFFELVDFEGQTVFYGNYEFYSEKITSRDKMYDCPQNLREEEEFLIPEWAPNKIVYQIFPSRFATTKDVPCDVWYKTPITHKDNLQGNLRGIINHLDHIKELGVDLIYMTPIFMSDSSHKYDTIDYYKIDPSFGTEEDLKELVQKAHSMGIKVMLDAVFNHTSPKFFAFDDVKKNEEKSKYLDWYYIDGFPLKFKYGEKPNFKTFAYYGGMPKLNLSNPEVADYFINVGKYWVQNCNIDGWRLDVGDEVIHAFWKRFRTEIRKINPQALIVGEIWHFAGDFLEGDEWDTVMNYPFFGAVRDFVATEQITATKFLEKLGFLRGTLNPKVYPILWNLIDSHDTNRFLHCCKECKQKQKLASAIQLLFPGMPMLYYGDEFGMMGAHDPDCRRGMVWDEKYQDKDMFEWYKNLIQIRKEFLCITEGTTIHTETDDEKG
jgi:glycosidase